MCIEAVFIKEFMYCMATTTALKKKKLYMKSKQQSKFKSPLQSKFHNNKHICGKLYNMCHRSLDAHRHRTIDVLYYVS